MNRQEYADFQARARRAMRARAREEIAILAGTDRASDGDIERFARVLGLRPQDLRQEVES